MVTLQRHIGTHRCRTCNTEFTVVSGPLFENGHPYGSYIVGLHGHSDNGRLAQMALALLDRRQPEAPAVVVALEVSATARELRLKVVDWSQSEWAGDTYLGTMLDGDEVVDSPLRPVVSDVAHRVLRELSEVGSYLA